MADKEIELDKPLIIYGKDVTKIPCFRSSILYGFGSGVGAALVVFLCTSKPRLASHAAVGSFVCVNTVHWIMCRHRHAHQKFGMAQIQGAYQKHLILEGTEKEKEKQKLAQAKVEVVDV